MVFFAVAAAAAFAKHFLIQLNDNAGLKKVHATQWKEAKPVRGNANACARARHSIIRLPVFSTLANRLSFSINIQIDWNRMHTIAIKWIHSYMQSIIMFPWVGVFVVLFFSALFGLVELAHAAMKQTVKDVKQCRLGGQQNWHNFSSYSFDWSNYSTWTSI